LPPERDVEDRPSRPPRRKVIGPFSARQLGLALITVVLTATAIALATRPLGSTGPGVLPDPRATAYLIGSPGVGLRPGDMAPELTVTRPDGTPFQLADLDGRPLRLADLRGKVVWLNFWASWCPPCQAETPVLREIASTYADRDFVLIGIEVQETVDDGRRYAQRYQVPYPIGADVSADIFHRYKVFALPTQFLIDREGIIRQVINGPVTQGSADALIGPLVAAGSPATTR
jgi:thiol-disulfide isomerase/thioredoxin